MDKEIKIFYQVMVEYDVNTTLKIMKWKQDKKPKYSEILNHIKIFAEKYNQPLKFFQDHAIIQITKILDKNGKEEFYDPECYLIEFKS